MRTNSLRELYNEAWRRKLEEHWMKMEKLRLRHLSTAAAAGSANVEPSPVGLSSIWFPFNSDWIWSWFLIICGGVQVKKSWGELALEGESIQRIGKNVGICFFLVLGIIFLWSWWYYIVLKYIQTHENFIYMNDFSVGEFGSMWDLVAIFARWRMIKWSLTCRFYVSPSLDSFTSVDFVFSIISGGDLFFSFYYESCVQDRSRVLSTEFW